MPKTDPVPADLPKVIRREDYAPPLWLVPDITIEFDLNPQCTLVKSRLSVRRNGAHEEPVMLNGEGLALKWLQVNGEPAQYRFADDILVIDIDGDEAEIESAVEIVPAANTQLMGLYESGGMLCTQCEAEGMRRIAFFPDRPDILSRYTVRLIADKGRYPVLLSNGDPVGQGEMEGGRHWAEWRDPYPKPCYLFALVAGNLAARKDNFVTRSGRRVELGIWVQPQDLPRTEHAMQSLKEAMAWDENVYGREYDLDVFNIVAVPDFNFGAMENKGLNIFNSRYVLADPETATDTDYDDIAAIVAHEYFHNWSGNRVTCRDWFQLSLKEGFTVFRDQQFSADQGSAAVKRIENVRMLRAVQFPEDGGPLAHPVRPDSYIEISNFYTATVYNKGAEVLRMLHTLLGREKFRAGSNLYFERHDGKAVTCEDFVQAMEDASGVDLSDFRLWYSQAGTPRISARLDFDERAKTMRLRLGQSLPSTPGQDQKKPMPIPLKVALFGRDGRKFDERLILLKDVEEEYAFPAIPERTVISINRDFSAPVIIDMERSADQLSFLSAHDDNPFARYEAMQQLMLDALIMAVSKGETHFDKVIDAVRQTLLDPSLDHAFKAETVLLPGESFIGEQMTVIDPEGIHHAREALRMELGRNLEHLWRDNYSACASNRYEYTPVAKGARRLRNVALNYIMAADASDTARLALRQFSDADNMTDKQAALAVLASSNAPEREEALDAFYQRYQDNPIVLDKWFAVQAQSIRDDTLDQVLKLAQHPDFTLTNPNRVRSLVGAFASNPRAFHSVSGRGYRFLGDMILKLDTLNPQVAACLIPPLGRWRRFAGRYAEPMKAELERILEAPALSKDVYEQASKSLH